MITDQQIEQAAKAAYWAAYDQYPESGHTHPNGFDLERAWQCCSPEQKVFNRHIARRVLESIEDTNN